MVSGSSPRWAWVRFGVSEGISTPLIGCGNICAYAVSCPHNIVVLFDQISTYDQDVKENFAEFRNFFLTRSNATNPGEFRSIKPDFRRNHQFFSSILMKQASPCSKAPYHQYMNSTRHLINRSDTAPSLHLDTGEFPFDFLE